LLVTNIDNLLNLNLVIYNREN